MNEEQRKTLLAAIDTIQYVDETDGGQACARCLERMIAEVLGLPLVDHMLLMDTRFTVKPLYCKSQYIPIDTVKSK